MVEDRDGITERGRIRDCRAAPDEGGIIANHVGEGQHPEPRRGGESQQPASFQPIQVLADDVQLVDRSARPEQDVRGPLHVVHVERRPGPGRQGRRAAGEKD